MEYIIHTYRSVHWDRKTAYHG